MCVWGGGDTGISKMLFEVSLAFRCDPHITAPSTPQNMLVFSDFLIHDLESTDRWTD